MMGWLKKLFGQDPATSEAKKERKAKKRQSKERSRKARKREKELSRPPQERFFFGSVAVDARQNVIRQETGGKFWG